MAVGETGTGGMRPLIANTAMGEAIRGADRTARTLGMPASWPTSLQSLLKVDPGLAA